MSASLSGEHPLLFAIRRVVPTLDQVGLLLLKGATDVFQILLGLPGIHPRSPVHIGEKSRMVERHQRLEKLILGDLGIPIRYCKIKQHSGPQTGRHTELVRRLEALHLLHLTEDLPRHDLLTRLGVLPGAGLKEPEQVGGIDLDGGHLGADSETEAKDAAGVTGKWQAA